MKKFKTFLFTIMCLPVFVLLAACGQPNKETEQPNKEIMTITEFDQFKDLSRNPVKIVVRYADAVFGEFEITDTETIQEVVTILFDRTIYINGGREPSAGNNGRMKFVESDGKEYYISLYSITYRKDSYYYQSEELLNKMYQIGMEKGALE